MADANQWWGRDVADAAAYPFQAAEKVVGAASAPVRALGSAAAGVNPFRVVTTAKPVPYSGAVTGAIKRPAMPQPTQQTAPTQPTATTATEDRNLVRHTGALSTAKPVTASTPAAAVRPASVVTSDPETQDSGYAASGWGKDIYGNWTPPGGWDAQAGQQTQTESAPDLGSMSLGDLAQWALTTGMARKDRRVRQAAEQASALETQRGRQAEGIETLRGRQAGALETQRGQSAAAIEAQREKGALSRVERESVLRREEAAADPLLGDRRKEAEARIAQSEAATEATRLGSSEARRLEGYRTILADTKGKFTTAEKDEARSALAEAKPKDPVMTEYWTERIKGAADEAERKAAIADYQAWLSAPTETHADGGAIGRQQPLKETVHPAVAQYGQYLQAASGAGVQPVPFQQYLTLMQATRGAMQQAPATFAEGGEVEDEGAIPVAGKVVRGPGTETSDSIPAIINGQRPAALSDGEYVIPAHIVRAKGTEFFDKLLAQYADKERDDG